MDSTEAIDLARQSVMLILIISLPVLVIGMLVGVVISILQAVTQVQEQTLSFVPKIVVMLLVAAATSPWVTAKLIDFSRDMFTSLP